MVPYLIFLKLYNLTNMMEITMNLFENVLLLSGNRLNVNVLQQISAMTPKMVLSSTFLKSLIRFLAQTTTLNQPPFLGLLDFTAMRLVLKPPN